MVKRLLAMAVLVVCICCFVLAPCAASSSISVYVDPRIELLAAVHLLSGYGEKTGLITSYSFEYKQDMEKYFQPYREHRAVMLFSEMGKRGFSFGVMPEAMLYLSDPPQLRQRLPFPENVKIYAGGEKQLAEFIEALRDFARVSNFQEFFEAHRDTYRSILIKVRREMIGTDWISDLEDYYGMKKESYNIILAPLFHQGGYGPQLQWPDGRCELFNISGPSDVADGLPIFLGENERLRVLSWHEFGHSFADPVTYKYREELAKYASLYDPIVEDIRKQGYGVWQDCVREHIVRAVEVRLIHHAIGKEAAEFRIYADRRKGFVYLEILCNQLEDYEKQRDKYPTFESFYPELVGVFKSLAEQDLGKDFYKLPFEGPISAVASDQKSMVFIVPTHESDKEAQNVIHGMVKRIREGDWFKDSPVMTDDEALNRDLSAKNIFVLGTLSGNSWLAKYASELPIKIFSDRIEARKTHNGENLRMIAAWPNPQNIENGVRVYTAQQARDLAGIHAIMHGSRDYVIANGDEVLEKGFFWKSYDGWTLEHAERLLD